MADSRKIERYLEKKRVILLELPLVSIITPCYNGENYLNRYFQSILNQTYPKLELIFVNDGSSDRTEKIAQQYQPILEQKGIRFIYLYQENAGQAAALNRGLKLFHGEYLTWPDADDEMTPDCIEKKVAYLRSHPELQMVRSDGIYYNQDSGEKHRIAKNEDKSVQDVFEKLLLIRTYGCCGCYMITKELLLHCYPERDIFESRVGQNWQLLVPAASRSLCGYIDEPLYTVYEHGDSHSRHHRTAEEMYSRWDMFTEVLYHAIENSRCDHERALRLINENNARQKFYYAVSDRDRVTMKAMLKIMKKYGSVTLKEYLLYLKSSFRG